MKLAALVPVKLKVTDVAVVSKSGSTIAGSTAVIVV
jgi:hypothetical protein